MSDKTLSFTQRSLAEALDNVRHLSDLGPEMIAEQVFAASAQQPALTVPEGWKLVPVDPTEEILDAICLAKNMTRRGLAVVMNMQELESIYRAMLAAAPAAPVAQEPRVIRAAYEVLLGCVMSPQIATLIDAPTVERVAKQLNDLLPGYVPPAAKQPTLYKCPRCGADIEPPAAWSAQVLCAACGNTSSATAARAAAERPDTVVVPREVLRELTDTAITEWHDPSVNEAAQDRNECLCCGVEDGHNADCAVAIALHLLGKDGEA